MVLVEVILIIRFRCSVHPARPDVSEVPNFLAATLSFCLASVFVSFEPWASSLEPRAFALELEAVSLES